MSSEANPPVPLDDQLCFAIYTAGIAIQRLYKPLLSKLGLTYPQYLVLNVLWQKDTQSVGQLADRLALESSTLTPLLKRLEAAGMVQRDRNPDNERQVLISLTPDGLALRDQAGCLGAALLQASGQQPEDLAELNMKTKQLRDLIYQNGLDW